MHEVSLMMSIMDTALQTAEREQAKRIIKISLQIGVKSGVVVDSLEFAFEMVSKNTIAEQATLEIETVPFRGECLVCGHRFESKQFLVCDKCGNFAKVLSGQELNIKLIEVE
jgi:hydrogenase nickel incorporation protein HypA/HybF